MAFALVTLLGPALLAGAALVDLALWLARRKPWMGVRLVAFLWWFLAVEMWGLAGVALVWLRAGAGRGGDTPRRRRAIFRLQVGWTTGLLAGVRVLFGLRFEVEGAELVGPGPVLVLIRHTSIVDNTLPGAFVSRPHGIDLRYVLKHELQSVPTLDIGGRWIPTCFVRRSSDDVEREIARVRSLAEGLGPRDGVLIYPEGTRCTPAKLARVLERLERDDPAVHALARGLRHVLPPRLGGPLALLEEGAASGASVVVCAHHGLDGFEKIGDIWSGALVGRTVRLRFWRHGPEEIPARRDERVAWLHERWQALDDWIEAQVAGAVAPAADVA